MIPVYICDDEPDICGQIAALVAKQILIADGDIGPVRAMETPEELLHSQQRDTVPAIYFLDIDFPGHISGLELAAELRRHDPRGFIIFITGHEDLAFETFRYRVEAMDYIVKGDDAHMEQRIQSCLFSVGQRLQNEPSGSGSYFTLKLFDTVRYIPYRRILYGEVFGNKHSIRLHMEDEILDFYGSLNSLEQELGAAFWRCHRSYLVNRSRIAKVYLKQSILELDNGETCLVSRKAKSEYQTRGSGAET